MKNNHLKKDLSVPDPLASNEEKLSDAYGLKMANSIAQEWFGGGFIDKNSYFSTRHLWIREMRLYNRGEQDIQKYKDTFYRQSEDKQLHNMDWSIINVAEKFTNITRNGISDDHYILDIRSTDKFALMEKEQKIMKHRVNMASKDMLERFRELHGIDLTPKGFVAEDEEELMLYSEIKDRPKQEIAEEILINYVKKISQWDQIKKETDKDLVLCDLQVARVFTDPNDGVKTMYVDPETYGHSYVERNDFSDAFYHFTVETITINDLRRESGFSEMVLRKIAKSYVHDNNHLGKDMDFDRVELNRILNFRINVMRFCFKSDKEITYKLSYDREGRLKKASKRDSNYEVPEGHEKSKGSKRLDTWYEGSYVIGSQEYIYGYKECENLDRDEMNKAQPPFIVQSTNIYKNRLRSFLSNIIPLCDDLQQTHLKIQHLRSELKPDLIELDLDQLADLNTDTKGDTKKKNWKQVLSVLSVKGVVLSKRTNLGEDGIKDGPGARPIANQQGSALSALLNIWEHTYNLIRETTGINPARDGSASASTLVGVNQMQQLASNTATKHLVDAALMFDKRVCERISSSIKNVFSFKEAKKLQKLYNQAVGKHNMQALESTKNRHLHEFGFFVEMIPGKEELDNLREDLAIALNGGYIDVSEKYEIMRIAKGNIKQAGQYMMYLLRRRKKEKMEQDAYNIEMQGKNNIQAAQAKAEAEIQTYQMKKQIDLQYQSNLSSINLNEKQATIQIEAPGKEKEFEQQVYMEKLKNYQVINLAKYKEDAKDERLKEQSTHQAELIDQRLKNSEPKNFKDDFSYNSLFN